MRGRTYLAVVVVFLIAVVPGLVWAAEVLTLLHLNDFHGRVFPYEEKAVRKDIPVGGAAYVAQMIDEERKKNFGGVILLSAGDMFQGTPVSNLYYGKPVLDFMNAVRFDAMTLGNHEFDWGRKAMADMVREARFPIVAANIITRTGQYLPGVRPYIIIERKGLKVAVIGLTTPQTMHMANAKYLKDVTFREPREVLPDLIQEVRSKGAAVVVLLTHLGFDVDKEIAGSVKGIDVIVGGHSHTVVSQPVAVGRTTVAQAGYNGVYLGVIELTVDRSAAGNINVTVKGQLKVVSAGPHDPFDRHIARLADGYGDKIKGKFQEIVGETGTDLVRRTDGESTMGNLVADAMREATGADIAVQNSGGIRADIPKGKITMEQVYTVLPFEDTLVSMDVRGSDLLELFEMSSSLGKGMLQLSGVKISYDMKKEPGRRVREVLVGNVPLDPGRTYRVVTNDFLAAGGDRFTALSKGSNTVPGGELRDAFLQYVRKHSPLTRLTDGRIVVLGP